MKRDHTQYLRDIQDSIRLIYQYTDNMSYEDFSSNQMAVDTVIRNLEIIGEASKKIPDTIKEKYPDAPWREMAGILPEEISPV